MSLFFNKQPPVFDENGFDDDGWTRQDHENLGKYGAKNPTKEQIEKVEYENRKEKEDGGWR